MSQKIDEIKHLLFAGETGDAYVKQIAAMVENMNKFAEAHEDGAIDIHFNFDRGSMVPVPISHGIAHGLVQANALGLEMLKAIWPWDDPSEPTVTMIQIALETYNVKYQHGHLPD